MSFFVVRRVQHVFSNFSLERLEHLAEKFRRKCAMHEEWSNGKEEALQSPDWKRATLYQLKVIIIVLVYKDTRKSSIMRSLFTEVNEIANVLLLTV